MAHTFGPQREARAAAVAKGLQAVVLPAPKRRWVLPVAALVLFFGAAVALRTSTGEQGLAGEYFDDVDLRVPKLTRVDREIAFDWGTGSPDPRVASETFSVRWTGRISSPVAGARALCLMSDDGARLWFDGKLVIDRWGEQWPTQNCAPVQFAAGVKHALRIEYLQLSGFAYVRLFWTTSGPTGPYVPVPPTYLHRP
jgi:hypothetical protein